MNLEIPKLQLDIRTKDEKLIVEHKRRKQELRKRFDAMIEQNNGALTYAILLRALQTDDRLISLLDSYGIWTEDARKSSFLRIFKSMDVAFQKEVEGKQIGDFVDEKTEDCPNSIQQGTKATEDEKEEKETTKDLGHISFSDMLSVLPPLKPDRSSIPDSVDVKGNHPEEGMKANAALQDLDFDYEEKRGEIGWARTSPRAMSQNKQLAGSVLGQRLGQAKISRVLVLDRMHLTSLPIRVCSLHVSYLCVSWCMTVPRSVLISVGTTRSQHGWK